MASTVRRDSYDPYRNISYAYDGSAARVPEQEEVLRPRPKVRPRDRSVAPSRPQIRVRAAGQVSPFAVVGFAAVIVMAVVLLMSYVRLSAISTELVTLSNQMDKLRSEEATLRARYELAYDLSSIESAVTADGSMSRPQAGQIVYVDLTEPDRVVRYSQAEVSTGGFLEGVEEVTGNLLAYFKHR